MNERIRELAQQAGFTDFVLTDLGMDQEVEKFAQLIIEDAESEAISLIKFIARDYVELSHDKVLWQRNDYIKRCQKFLDKYRGVEE